MIIIAILLLLLDSAYSGPADRLCAPSSVPRKCAVLPTTTITALMYTITNAYSNVKLRWQKENYFLNVNDDMAQLMDSTPPVALQYMPVILDELLAHSSSVFRYGQWVISDDIRTELMSIMGLDTATHKETVTSFWASSAGVHTAAHYDTHQNVFIQLRGRKHFRFMPPEHMLERDIYPRFHMLERQLKHGPQCYLGTLEFEIGPGDVLFIPPFWVHEPVAKDNSLSLSLMQEVVQHIGVIRQARGQQFPHQTQWSWEQSRAGLATYLSAFAGNKSMMALAQYRYEIPCKPQISPNECIVSNGVWALLVKLGKEKQRLFATIPNLAARTMTIQDHAEFVVAQSVGVKMLPKFFAQCFSPIC